MSQCCPQCHSQRIEIENEMYTDATLICFKCGHREAMIDYPTAWGTRERYELYGGQEQMPPQIQSPVEPPWDKKQWDYVQQLMGEMKHLENKLQKHITEKKRRDHDFI